MKLHLPMLWMLAAATSALAQSPVQEVIDNMLIQNVNTNTQNILSMLQQQLDEAKKQSENLNDQLTRMGDPSAITLPALELIKQDIAQSAEKARTITEDRKLRLSGGTSGTEVFGDTTFGLMNAVDSTYTFQVTEDKQKKDVTVDRDPTLYKLQGALMGDLNDFATKSEEADQRIAALEEQRLTLLDEINSATDLATIIKFQTSLSVIESQITSARDDLTKTKQDYEVLKEKLTLQAQVESRARAEGKSLERKYRQDTAKAKSAASASGGSAAGGGSSASGGSAAGGSTKPFSSLGWGSK